MKWLSIDRPASRVAPRFARINVAITAITVAMLGAGVASAAPSKILVLQSEGRADAKVRQKIDQTIVKLARTGTDTVSPGEITYSDAAAMVGCKPEESACKDEVIGTLAVDELIITTVNPKPGGLEVHVRRVGKGGAAREATMVVAADKVDKLDSIAPLFGAKQGPTPPEPAPTPIGPIGPKPAPTPIGPKPPEPTPAPTPTPAPQDALPDLTKPEPKTTATTEPVKPLEQPGGSDDRWPRDRRKLYIGGMAGGGGMFLIGVILWASANGVEGDIDDIDVRSAADLERIRELESKGDGYAAWGNIFAISGMVIGGISTYFYIKDRRKRAASTARLAPAIFDRGAGLTLTIGGSP